MSALRTQAFGTALHRFRRLVPVTALYPGNSRVVFAEKCGKRIILNGESGSARPDVRRVCELVSSHTGDVVPRKGLRVRVPCPPLGRCPV
jgi:hypothetical protein